MSDPLQSCGWSLPWGVMSDPLFFSPPPETYGRPTRSFLREYYALPPIKTLMVNPLVLSPQQPHVGPKLFSLYHQERAACPETYTNENYFNPLFILKSFEFYIQPLAKPPSPLVQA